MADRLAALLALARMRDQDASLHVLPLLEHKDARVKVKAIEFLALDLAVERLPFRAERLCDPG